MTILRYIVCHTTIMALGMAVFFSPCATVIWTFSSLPVKSLDTPSLVLITFYIVHCYWIHQNYEGTRTAREKLRSVCDFNGRFFHNETSIWSLHKMCYSNWWQKPLLVITEVRCFLQLATRFAHNYHWNHRLIIVRICGWTRVQDRRQVGIQKQTPGWNTGNQSGCRSTMN